MARGNCIAKPQRLFGSVRFHRAGGFTPGDDMLGRSSSRRSEPATGPCRLSSVPQSFPRFDKPGDCQSDANQVCPRYPAKRLKRLHGHGNSHQIFCCATRLENSSCKLHLCRAFHRHHQLCLSCPSASLASIQSAHRRHTAFLFHVCDCRASPGCVALSTTYFRAGDFAAIMQPGKQLAETL